MASERCIDKTQYPDLYQTKTFGPYAEANTGTNNYLRLPFLESKDVVIDEIAMRADVAGAADTNLALAKSASAAAAPSGAVSTANRVSTDIADTALTANTIKNVPVHATTGLSTGMNNNLLAAGSALWLYSLAAATNLAGLYITVRYRERRQ